MKKLLIVAFLVIYGTSVAQETDTKRIIPKGSWTIGGNLGFSANNSEFSRELEDDIERKNHTYSLLPKIGYTISENLIIGLGLGYSFSKDDINDDNSKTNSYNFTPYIRKHYGIGQNLSLFIQGEGNYEIAKQKNTNSNYENTSKSLFIGFRPGLNYFISKKVALETTIVSFGYKHRTSEVTGSDNSKTDTNSFNFNIDSANLNFGVIVFL